MLFATILVFELLNTDNARLEYCDWAEHTYIKMQRQTFTFHSLFKSRIVLPFWNLWKHFNCTIKSFDGLLSCCRTGLAQLNFLWINPVWNENSFTLLWQLPENLLKNAHFRSIFLQTIILKWSLVWNSPHCFINGLSKKRNITTGKNVTSLFTSLAISTALDFITK